ncbi:MAG: plastocyanin/azurin family copper-binding protein [Dehalococcoidia bacterium]
MKFGKFLFLGVLVGLLMAFLAVGCGGDDDDDATEEAGDDVEATEPAGDDDGGGGATNVAIVDFAFEPDGAEVAVGDTVTWTNTGDAPHTVTSDEEGVWDSGNLDNGQTFEFTFEEAGEIAYHCTIHPDMTGTITVQ